MNAAPRSVLPQRRPYRRPTASSRVTSSSAAAHLSAVRGMTPVTGGQKVEKLNVSRQPTPSWLSFLLFLQRGSDLIAFLLVATTLTIYSWTVYSQQQWAKEYRKLETLQRNERHLTSANELMKDQLAQQAERPATGLVTPTQANTIFLPPAPQRQVSAPPRAAQPEPEATSTSPLGY